MIHILLEGSNIRTKWLFRELKYYIKPFHRIAVVAFSFRDSRIKDLSDWNAWYGNPGGKAYREIVGGFAAYGIPSEQISFLNYFTDTRETAGLKIRDADIIYFLGGLPDRMMDRIREFDLETLLVGHQGMMMGYSAGALVQLSEYHLSPDHDYPSFRYGKGLSCIDGFYLEVHYEGTEDQKASIRRVIGERGKPVYATSLMKGAVLVDGERVLPLGEVYEFRNGKDV